MRIMFWLVAAVVVVFVLLIALMVWVGPSPILWAGWLLWATLAFGTVFVHEAFHN